MGRSKQSIRQLTTDGLQSIYGVQIGSVGFKRDGSL